MAATLRVAESKLETVVMWVRADAGWSGLGAEGVGESLEEVRVWRGFRGKAPGTFLS